MSGGRVHTIFQAPDGKISICELTPKGYEGYNDGSLVAEEGTWEEWSTIEKGNVLETLGLKE